MKLYSTLLMTTVALVLGTSAVASASDVLPPPPGKPQSQSALAAREGYLVVTVAFSDAPGSTTLPSTPGITAFELARSLTEQVNPWFAAVSQGVYSGESATPHNQVVSIKTTTRFCSLDWLGEIMNRGDAAIREQGREPGDFKAVIYYVSPRLFCELPGAASGNRIALDGRFGLDLLVHEIGHTLGLGHANSMVCWNAEGAFVPLPGFDGGTCSHDEYGDVYSAMGNRSMMYASSQLEFLGWNTGRVERLDTTTPAVAKFLTPIENDIAGSTEALRIDDGVALWLEYRTFTGVDNQDSRYRGGLVVRAEQTGVQAPLLLNMRPEESPDPFDRLIRPEMAVGQTWRNPRGNLSITLNSTSPLGASVTISQTPHRVPDIRRLTPTAARDAIAAAGYVVGTTSAIAGCEDIGTVISQDPSQGAPLLPRGVVNFTFGVPPAAGCSGPQQ